MLLMNGRAISPRGSIMFTDNAMRKNHYYILYTVDLDTDRTSPFRSELPDFNHLGFFSALSLFYFSTFSNRSDSRRFSKIRRMSASCFPCVLL